MLTLHQSNSIKTDYTADTGSTETLLALFGNSEHYVNAESRLGHSDEVLSCIRASKHTEMHHFGNQPESVMVHLIWSMKNKAYYLLPLRCQGTCNLYEQHQNTQFVLNLH